MNRGSTAPVGYNDLKIKKIQFYKKIKSYLQDTYKINKIKSNIIIYYATILIF